MFEPFGELEFVQLQKDENGRSRGYGFVQSVSFFLSLFFFFFVSRFLLLTLLPDFVKPARPERPLRR